METSIMRNIRKKLQKASNIEMEDSQNNEYQDASKPPLPLPHTSSEYFKLSAETVTNSPIANRFNDCIVIFDSSTYHGEKGNLDIKGGASCPSTSNAISSVASEVDAINADNHICLCVSSLKNKYRTKFSYMRSFLWTEKGYDYPIEDYFISLEVNKCDRMGYLKSKKNIPLNKLFGNDDKKILITGDPGFGKTTLTKKLSYDWATRQTYMLQFVVVIVLTLRDVEGTDIWTAIADFLFGKERKCGVEELKHTALNFLVLLDGFDEISNKMPVLSFVNKVSANITVVLTSRPYAVKDAREEFHLRLSISGFSKENQKNYIYLTKSIHAIGKVDVLIEKLENDKFLSDLAQCPLILHMFCCLHKDKDLSTLNTLTVLYIEIFRLIIGRYLQRHKDGDFSFLKKVKVKWLEGENILIRLGELAWKYLKNEIPFITSTELSEVFSDKDEYQFVTSLDIFISTPITFEGKEITAFDPLHRTYLEFLSSLYAVSVENSSIFNFSEDQIYTVSDKTTFIYKMNYSLVFYSTNTFLFICGLVEDKNLIVHGLTETINKWNAIGYFQLMYHYLRALRKEYSDVWKRCCSKLHTLHFEFGDFSTDVPDTFLEYSPTNKLIITESNYSCHLYYVGVEIENILRKYPSIKRVVFRFNPYKRFYKFETGNSVTYCFDIRFVFDMFLNFDVELYKDINFDICVHGFSKSTEQTELTEPVKGLCTDCTSDVCFPSRSRNDGTITIQYKHFDDITTPNELIYIISTEQYKLLHKNYILGDNVNQLDNLSIKFNDDKISAIYKPPITRNCTIL